MDRDLYLVLIGAAAAVFGGVIGGFAQGWAWYVFERRRARVEKQDRDVQKVLDWARRGASKHYAVAISDRQISMTSAWLQPRHAGAHIMADLSKSDLRQADLSNADMGFTKLRGVNFCHATLKRAGLAGADLTGADLRSTSLEEACLEGANLADTKLVSTRWDRLRYGLRDTWLKGAIYSNETTWPKGFTPPAEAVNIGTTKIDAYGSPVYVRPR